MKLKQQLFFVPFFLLIISCGKKEETSDSLPPMTDGSSVEQTTSDTPQQSEAEKQRLAAEAASLKAQNPPEASDDVMTVNGDKVFYKLRGSVCGKITGVTQLYAEGVAQKYSISSSSVNFVRFENPKPDDCGFAIIDTPIGPKHCLVGSVVKAGSDYLIHTYRKADDGFEMVFSGNCLENR